jgi:hypothetical protein
MPQRQVTPGSKWHVEVELEVERLALSVQYVQKGQGSKVKRILVPTEWLDVDEKTIIWDAGKRLKGWLKEQVVTMKPSWRDRIQNGVVCLSLPTHGFNPIAKLEDIAPSRNWRTFSHREEYDLNGLPEPNVEVIRNTEGKTIFAFHYVLSKPVTVKVAIYSIAGGVRPESVEGWLREIGPMKGLGDMHTSSTGYGLFTLKSFKVAEEKELNF